MRICFQENLDEAALAVQKVHADVLSDRMREIYSAVCNATGVTGIEDGTSGEAGTTGNPESDDQGSDGQEDESESYEETGYEETGYEEDGYEADGYDEENYY